MDILGMAAFGARRKNRASFRQLLLFPIVFSTFDR
uniref:Uncharacterized protein n=1 Tax=Anguilla anguilla TaxID=7936 RepID=A0A0E9RDV1_ANGAN